MPISPTTRAPTVRGLRTENHKRGRSLESAILFRERDGDLALFNEAQNRERDGFLLQSNDDFDDIFSTKLRYFSDYKLGISIPAHGESSDMLKAEGDKNDYDWLITPPDTPLFPSLDDDAGPVSLAPRGRPRGPPVAMSQSSTMEKGHRSARSSSSPHRFSPSPRSGNSPLQPRSRPFSAIHASPPPTLRHSSPLRRLSSPPSKPTPATRSATPTRKKTSTGSADASAPARARGTSPVKKDRGSFASPKIKAWQSNIPGFSSEVPPNLRTSLADRPASYVRGSSPTSRNSSRSARQSMSPIGSRSVGSSHSHKEEQFSSYRRGSIVSSGDDDIDLQQSNCRTSSDHSVSRATSPFPNNRAMGSSKKPNKILSSSGPKRSLDLVLRQMEQKNAQNMFRPLLSSVPSSTFYAGKANVHQHPVISRNSFITTSSNASSDQGMVGALDTEESMQTQDDTSSNFGLGQYLIVRDGVSITDRAETAVESPDHQHGEIDVALSQLGVTATQLEATVLDRKYGSSDVKCSPDVEVCCKCNHRFHPSELSMEGDQWLCHECCSEVKLAMIDENNTEGFVLTLECGMLEVLEGSASITESVQVNCTGEMGPNSTNHLDNIARIANYSQQSYGGPIKDPVASLSDEVELTFANQIENDHSVDGATVCLQSQQFRGCSDLELSVSQDTGMSLFPKRSIGRKYFVHCKSFTASNSSYDDFSYPRDSSNSMRSSIGHSSASLSSSIDLGSSRQSDTCIHRQSSGKKSEMGNYRYDRPSKHQRSVSSLSGASGNEATSGTLCCLVDALEVIAPNKDKNVVGVTSADPYDQSLASECADTDSMCIDLESNIILKNTAEPSSQLVDDFPGETSVVSILVSEEPASHENGDGSTDVCGNSADGETLSVHLLTCTEVEDGTQSSCGNQMVAAEVPHPSSLDAILEMEIENADNLSANAQSTVDSPNVKNCNGELMEPSALVAFEAVVTTTVGEYDTGVPTNGILEESTILVEEVTGGTKPRSLTLEEATDSILFCRSLVYNLAYEAADIATSKDNSPPPPPVEVQRPTATLVDKTNSDRRDLGSRTLRKRSFKSKKSRERRLETDTKPCTIIAETDENSSPHNVRSPLPGKGNSSYPPNLESKCNCTIM